MKTQTKNHIATCVQSAKERFENFSETESQKVFLIIKEAKAKGLLRKQPYDRCLNGYINVANYLLRVQSTEEFGQALTQNIDCVYAYVALVATNSILTTA